MTNNKENPGDNQHYVPKFLLKNFHIPENDKKVFVLYKNYRETQNYRKKIEVKSVRSICSEQHFLNIGSKDKKSPLNLDSIFTTIENKAPDLISKIISSNLDIKSINPIDRKTISELAAFSLVRMYAVRKAAEDAIKEQEEQDLNTYLYNNYIIFTDDIVVCIRALHASLISQLFTNNSDNEEMVINLLINKFNNLELDLIFTDKDEFVITDSPVLYNPYGETYLPISPKHCLHLHPENCKIPLSFYYINEFLYMASCQYVIANNESILAKINNNVKKEYNLQDEFKTLENFPNKYWLQLLNKIYSNKFY